jgi:MFS family permease
MTSQIRWILFGQFLSTTGTWAQNFAVAWIVYRQYDSAFLLGLVACLNQLPALLVGRFAGRCVDLHLSRKFMLVVQTLLILQCVLLIGATRLALSVEVLVALCLLQGLLFAFEMPAIQTFIANMVEERAAKARVATWNSLSVNAGRLVAPALAGGLMARFGEAACFAFNGASYLPLIAALLLVRGWKRALPAAAASQGQDSAAGGRTSAWRHIAATAALREPLIAAAAMFALTMPFLSYIPAITTEQLGGAAGVYSAMAFATGIGAAIASVWAARLKDFSQVARIVPPAIVAGGLVLAVLTVSASVYLSGMLFVLLGFCMNLTGTLTNAWLHMNAPEKWRGSVASSYNMASALYPIGSITVGLLALAFPVMRVLMAAGALCALFVLVRRYLLPDGRWTGAADAGPGAALSAHGRD